MKRTETIAIPPNDFTIDVSNTVMAKISVTSLAIVQDSLIDLNKERVLTFKIKEPVGEIGFLNATPGIEYKLIVVSDGKYKFKDNIIWPSNISPVPSEKGKIDLFSFVADDDGFIYGTFAFNYSKSKEQKPKILEA